MLKEDETRMKTLRRAMDAGMNWVNKAPLYRRGRSEEALGWLPQNLDDQPSLPTTMDFGEDDLHDLAAAVERCMHASL